jgi:hypothetical protein
LQPIQYEQRALNAPQVSRSATASPF